MYHVHQENFVLKVQELQRLIVHLARTVLLLNGLLAHVLVGQFLHQDLVLLVLQDNTAELLPHTELNAHQELIILIQEVNLHLIVYWRMLANLYLDMV